MGNCWIYYWNRGYYLYGYYDYTGSIKMRRSFLQGLSLIISALVLLYLLFINIQRGTFLFADWVVVTVDILAKTIIELILLSKR